MKPEARTIDELKSEIAKLNANSVNDLLRQLEERTKTDQNFASLVKELKQKTSDLRPHLADIREEDDEGLTWKDVVIIIIIIVFFP
jgi:predicted  nucleic acid-binding Zn-ribbon protein